MGRDDGKEDGKEEGGRRKEEGGRKEGEESSTLKYKLNNTPR
jgi:hypothetical protein